MDLPNKIRNKIFILNELKNNHKPPATVPLRNVMH